MVAEMFSFFSNKLIIHETVSNVTIPDEMGKTNYSFLIGKKMTAQIKHTIKSRPSCCSYLWEDTRLENTSITE